MNLKKNIFIKNPNKKIRIQFVYYFNKRKSISPGGYVYEIPLYKQPVFKKYNKLKLSNSEKYCSKHICLPIFTA